MSQLRLTHRIAVITMFALSLAALTTMPHAAFAKAATSTPAVTCTLESTGVSTTQYGTYYVNGVWPANITAHVELWAEFGGSSLCDKMVTRFTFSVNQPYPPSLNFHTASAFTYMPYESPSGVWYKSGYPAQAYSPTNPFEFALAQEDGGSYSFWGAYEYAICAAPGAVFSPASSGGYVTTGPTLKLGAGNYCHSN